jgi:predicted DNA-binding transcriptional regulator AlpA
MQTQIKADERAAEKRAAVATTLASLPPDLGRNRVLDAAVASAFWGVSLPHWRRLYRTGIVPRPIKIGERKLGWRIGALADALAVRDGETARCSVVDRENVPPSPLSPRRTDLRPSPQSRPCDRRRLPNYLRPA